MSFSARLVRAAKFGLAAATLAAVSTVLATPVASAETVPTVVETVEEGAAGPDSPAFRCTRTTDYDDVWYSCQTFAGPGAIRAFVTCSSGFTYYSSWYGAWRSFKYHVHCGGHWTRTGIQGR